MLGMIFPKRPQLRSMRNEKTGVQDREPEMCWREIVQLATDGFYPSDQRLENLIDRIERRP